MIKPEWPNGFQCSCVDICCGPSTCLTTGRMELKNSIPFQKSNGKLANGISREAARQAGVWFEEQFFAKSAKYLPPPDQQMPNSRKHRSEMLGFKGRRFGLKTRECLENVIIYLYPLTTVWLWTVGGGGVVERSTRGGRLVTQSYALGKMTRRLASSE